MRDELGEAHGHRLQLLDQARLADPGLADELGDLALAQARGFERRPELVDLPLAADERELLCLFLLGHAHDRADAVGGDRPLLALDEEGLRSGLEARAGALEHLAGGQDLARLGPRGQTRREIDDVAHDGVRAARAGAHVAGERRSAVDARPQGQGGVGVQDRPQRPEHPFLVGAGARRCAGGQVELAPVDVDVGLEPCDPELRRQPADECA